MTTTYCPIEVTIYYGDGFEGGYGYGSSNGAVLRIERVSVDAESDLVRWLDKTEFWSRAATVEMRMKNGQTIVAHKLSSDDAKDSDRRRW